MRFSNVAKASEKDGSLTILLCTLINIPAINSCKWTAMPVISFYIHLRVWIACTHIPVYSMV